MNLILAEYEIHADILEKSSFISQYTGRELKSIKVNATIEGKEVNEKIIGYLRTVRTDGINSKDGQITKKWKLINKSYSYTNDKNLVKYSLKLDEMEYIKLTKLILDDLELEPYQYKEDFDYNDFLSAKIRVLLSKEQFKKFKELIGRDSFTVIRQGINENPRQMHLYLNAWSKDEEGTKLEFKLYDLKGAHEISPIYPLWRLVYLVIKQDHIIKQLSNLLVQKDVITKKECENIKTEIPDKNLDPELELYQVKDLDEWDF